ncbi:MAG: hypothetical protein ABIN74_07400 [Ferruginibacter sp.]
MRKQTHKSIIVNNVNQFKDGRKNMPAKKNPRYIYTEADLGEGILDVGIPSFYKTDQQDNIHTKPWANMLKTAWS